MTIENIKCVFICSGEYPDNQASAIRHTLFARGLAELGWPIEMWLLTPQPWIELGLSRSYGLKFIKLNGFLNGTRWKRALCKFLAIIRASKRMIRLAACNIKGERVAAVFYCTELEFLVPMIMLAKAFNIPIIHERTEFPYVVSKKTLFGKLSLKLYLRFVLPVFDRVMVINDELGKYIRNYNSRTEKLLTVVDVKEFRPSERSRFIFPYIAYCGTMYGNKDGLDVLVRAFSVISLKFPAWRLVLVGDNSKSIELAPLIRLIEELGVRDKVIFTGRVERQEVPIILRSAKVLALAKPSNEQNFGNFPIKLGEYLATGVPVVVTDVGEISNFIQDGITGYLSSPNVNSFADRLEFAISNPCDAAMVGARGSDLAERLFSFRSQSDILSGVIAKVVSSR